MTDALFLALSALKHSIQVVVSDDGLVVLHDMGKWLVTDEVVTELDDKGWIDLSVDGQVTVTEKGLYWLSRWEKRRPR